MNTPAKLHTCEPQKPKLDRCEWDFRPGPDHKKKTKKGDWTGGIQYDFLPEDESFTCWEYEFCRSNNLTAEFWLRWRAGADKPKDFDSLLDHYWRTDPNGKAGHSLVSNWFYMIWPEWPEKPYLSVPPAERLRRFKRTWEKKSKKSKRQIRLIPLRDIYRFVVAVKAGETPKPLILGETYQTEMEDDAWVLTSSADRKKTPPIEVAAFEIDFTLPDKRLAARFQNWLKERRKEKGYNRPDERGSRANRSDLIALGAMRLMDCGLSIKEATEYSRKISGRPLYEDAGDWTRARKRAGEAMYRAS